MTSFGSELPLNPKPGDHFTIVSPLQIVHEWEEFELTGQPDGDYPPYHWVFGSPRFQNGPLEEGETWQDRAKKFVQQVTALWDNVTVKKRIVTQSEWEDVTDEFMDDDA